MSSPLPSAEPAEAGPDSHVINDFSIQVATVNGSGSQTANLVLLRSIFQMGVPVSGKNLFPSNIQGLPTWYEIRVNGAGHTGRAEAFDLVVAMNPATYATDIASVRPGGWLAVMTCFQTDDTRFRDWHYRHDPTHVVFYREATFRHIASSRGWSLEVPVKDVALMRRPPDQPAE